MFDEIKQQCETYTGYTFINPLGQYFNYFARNINCTAAVMSKLVSMISKGYLNVGEVKFHGCFKTMRRSDVDAISKFIEQFEDFEEVTIYEQGFSQKHLNELTKICLCYEEQAEVAREMFAELVSFGFDEDEQ